jgi:antitoxin YefM
MDAVTYTFARNNLASLMNRVCDNSEVVLIMSPKKKVVMMSLEDYESFNETQYLLSNPANAAHLRKSLQELEEGKGIRHGLIRK